MRLKVILILLGICRIVTESFSQINQTDSLTLVSLYQSTNGPSWSNHTNWLSGKVSTWYGITLDNGSNFVIGISLPNNNLKGPLPAELANVIYLHDLNLSGNQINGNIPITFYTLSTLFSIDLSVNQISGPVTNAIYGMYGTNYLDLSSNQISGPIPDSIFTLINLTELYLNNNQLSGEINSALISRLVNLTQLDLSANKIDCRIPSGLNKLIRLTNLNLSNNRFDDMDALNAFFSNNPIVVDVSGNQLQFGDLEKNYILNFKYNPQDSVNFPINLHDNANQLFDIKINVSGAANFYQWYKDGNQINNEVANEIIRGPLLPSDAGTYILEISSDIISGLVLHSKPIKLDVNPCLNKVAAKDSLALVAIYNALDGPHWTINTGWLSAPLSGPVNSWNGIAIDCGHVVNVNLPGNNLKGAIPAKVGDLLFLANLDLSGNPGVKSFPNEMGNLTDLTVLSVAGDSINSSFPSWITKLTMLQSLDMGGTHLSGPIPESISTLGNLQSLYLPYNALSGPLPSSICEMISLTDVNLGVNSITGNLPEGISELANLQYLHLDSNPNITGTIPASYGSLSHLQELYLGGDHLTGTLPSTIGNLISLTTLDCSSNQFTGTIPTSFSNLSNLQSVNLSNCQFTGSVFSTLYSCTKLTTIHVENNQLNDSLSSLVTNWPNLQYLNAEQNNLKGTIPPQLGSLPNLSFLDLATNQIQGPLPPQLWDPINLTELHLQDNLLTGTIPPPSAAQFQLYYVNLGGNKFTGPIPKEFGSLILLNHLDLARNQLSGSIPVELGNLKQLSTLVVGQNLLTGSIPKELGNCINLAFLFADGNQLSGGLPPELGNCKNLLALVVASNKLTGVLPSSYANFNKIYWLDLGNNQLTDSIPSFFKGYTNMSYLFLNDNKFTYIPDLTPVMSHLLGVLLGNNHLTFESIEPYYKIKNRLTSGFNYAPQDSSGLSKNLIVRQGCPQTFTTQVGGSQNIYQWYKDGNALSGKTSSALSINPVASTDAGIYTCTVTNTLVTGLTIYVRPATMATTPVVNTALSVDPNNQLCNARTLIATPAGLYQYQWYQDGKKIVGATQNTLATYYNGNYTVTYQPDATSCSLTTTALSVIGLYADIQPVISSAGSPVTKLITSYAAYAYQWFVNDKVIAQAKADTLNIWYNGSYYLIVQLNDNCQYRSNTINVNESKYSSLARLMTQNDTIKIVAPNTLLSISPNPAKDSQVILIEDGSGEATGIECLDNNGNVIFRKEFGTPFHTTQLDISSWPGGLYFISVNSDQKRLWQKLVKY